MQVQSFGTTGSSQSSLRLRDVVSEFPPLFEQARFGNLRYFCAMCCVDLSRKRSCDNGEKERDDLHGRRQCSDSPGYCHQHFISSKSLALLIPSHSFVVV
jgi:hypothetical protein